MPSSACRALLLVALFFGDLYSARGAELVNSTVSERNSDTMGDAADLASPSLVFDSHLSLNPDTVGHLKFNYDNFPGALLAERSVYTSSLSLGLGKRWEVGIIPAFYLFPGIMSNDVNFTVKYNLYRSQAFSFAFGFYYNAYAFALKSKELDAIENNPFSDRANVVNSGLNTVLSYQLSRHYSLGLTLSGKLTQAEIPYKNKERGVYRFEDKFSLEEYLDICYAWNSQLSFTAGLTRTLAEDNSSSVSDSEPSYEAGYGMTATLKRPKSFLSKPGLGFHYLAKQQKVSYLFSTTIY